MTGVEESAIQNEIRKLRRKEDEAFQQEAQKRQIQMQRQYGGREKEDKGLLDAQKSLLYFSASHRHIYEILQKVLDKDDFPTEVYGKAFEAMGTLWEEAGNVFPAELISFFEEGEAQRRVTEIFAAQPPADDGFDLQKAVNEAAKVLKRAKIDRKTAQASTVEEIQQLVEEKRKLEALHITI